MPTTKKEFSLRIEGFGKFNNAQDNNDIMKLVLNFLDNLASGGHITHQARLWGDAFPEINLLDSLHKDVVKGKFS